MGHRFLIILVVLLFGCSVLDDHESQPAYVVIEEVSVNNPDGSGTVTHDIRDLWSYLDGSSLGVYPHPTHIACLPQNETVTVSFIAGIRNNGIAYSISIYPMLDPVEWVLDMKPGENYSYNPVFNYRNNVIKRFETGFESAFGIFEFDADGNASSGIVKDTEIKRSGNASGLIVVPDTTDMLDFVEVATSEAYIGIPTDGTPVYLEIDYRATANLFIGLIGYQDPVNQYQPLKSYYLGLKPTDEWEKIYVNLTEPLLQSDLNGYRILIRAENTEVGNVETVHLDNIKLLHF